MNIFSVEHKYELSTKEKMVLGLMKEGFSSVQISVKLQISKDDVQKYIGAIFFKLKVQNRTQSVAKAVKESIL